MIISLHFALLKTKDHQLTVNYSVCVFAKGQDERVQAIYQLSSLTFIYKQSTHLHTSAASCYHVTQHTTQIWTQSGSDWPQMGQLRDFFRLDLQAKMN